MEALKSTSIIAGSSVVVLLVRMLRTKALALLLGPAGIGLEAVLDSVVGFARSVFELGISSSGVRQIAAAAGTKNQERIATTVFTLRRTCLVLGTIGAVALYALREPIARLAFGGLQNAGAIGAVALMLLFGIVAAGQSALLQGLRQIRQLATLNIVGAVAALVLSVPIVWIWGQAGIPAYMVAGAGVSLVVSWIYARRIRVQAASGSLRESGREAAGLLKLGVAFMASGFVSTGAMFALRLIVTRESGVEGAGQFQAANALSMVYVGFILQAMGTDFYPRLTAVADRNERCNQTVNEQAEISLLLALPGIVGTLALAPWIVHLFYTGRFDPAAEILAWQIVGMLLRVVSWPMGFVLLAKGKGVALVVTDALAYGFYVWLAWLGLRHFGLPGTGMAFLGLYAFHSVMMYVVVRRLSGFRWSGANLRLISIALGCAALTLAVRLTLPDPSATLIGCGLAAATAGYCVRAVLRLLGPATIQRYAQRVPLVGALLSSRTT